MATLIYCLIVGLVLWALASVDWYIRTGLLKLNKFKFSVKNYHYLVSVFVFGLLFESLNQASLQLLIYFFVFAIAGVIGETLFSFWWHIFFSKHFWIYRIDTLMHSYTSLLNFVPWGVGGLLYLTIAQYLNFSVKDVFYFWFGIILLVVAIFQLGIYYVFVKKFRKEYKFHELNALNYIFFCFFVHTPWIPFDK